MKRSLLIMIRYLLPVWLLIGWPVNTYSGGTEAFNPIDADALIEKCWSISKEDIESGVTARMRGGSARSAKCLQDVILDQVEVMFDPKTLTRKEAFEKLQLISEGVQTLYWSIFNQHRKCRRWCGTDRHVYHLAHYADLLEHMIRDMVRERNEIGF